MAWVWRREGLLEVGLRAGGQQIADQAQSPAPSRAAASGWSRRPFGPLRGPRASGPLGRALGRGSRGTGDCRARGGRPRWPPPPPSRAAPSPPARGCAASGRGRCPAPATTPAPGRGGSGRSGSSSVVSARSTNGSAEIGSRMICDTFIEGLPGSLPASNANSTPRSG